MLHNLHTLHSALLAATATAQCSCKFPPASYCFYSKASPFPTLSLQDPSHLHRQHGIPGYIPHIHRAFWGWASRVAVRVRQGWINWSLVWPVPHPSAWTPWSSSAPLAPRRPCPVPERSGLGRLEQMAPVVAVSICVDASASKWSPFRSFQNDLTISLSNQKWYTYDILYSEGAWHWNM